jgi:hypothetical protein
MGEEELQVGGRTIFTVSKSEEKLSRVLEQVVSHIMY